MLSNFFVALFVMLLLVLLLVIVLFLFRVIIINRNFHNQRLHVILVRNFLDDVHFVGNLDFLDYWNFNLLDHCVLLDVMMVDRVNVLWMLFVLNFTVKVNVSKRAIS